VSLKGGIVQIVEIGGEIERNCVAKAQNTAIGARGHRAACSGCITLALHNSLDGRGNSNDCQVCGQAGE
jgi:hypothetical protein